MNTGPTRKQIEDCRREAAKLFEQDLSNAEIGRRIGVSRPTVSGWHQAWLADRQHGLDLKPVGRRARLTDPQRHQLVEALLQGPQAQGYTTPLWTLARIARLIQAHFRVDYNSHYVAELLHALGWSCQKPQTRAKERNDAEIARWVAEEWPRIKKGR